MRVSATLFFAMAQTSRREMSNEVRVELLLYAAMRGGVEGTAACRKRCASRRVRECLEKPRRRAMRAVKRAVAADDVR